MTNPTELLASPEATEQLLRWGALRKAEDKIAFIKAGASPALVLHIAESERDESVLGALGEHNADCEELFGFALGKEMVTLTRPIAAHTKSESIKLKIYEYVAESDRPGYNPGYSRRSPGSGAIILGFDKIKRDYVDARQKDPKFIATAAHHGDPLVRAQVAKHASLKVALELLKDDSKVSWDQRRIVIERFANSRKIADVVVNRRGESSGNDREYLARSTHNRATGVMLRPYGGINQSPARSIAARWANDAEMAGWFVDHKSELDTLATWSKLPQIRARLHEIAIQPLPSTGPLHVEMVSLMGVLAKQESDDTELALAASVNHYPDYIVERFAAGATSNDTKLALCRSYHAQENRNVRHLIARGASPEVLDALEDARLRGLEQWGTPTVRTVAKLAPEKLIKALRSEDETVRELAQTTLRELSAALSTGPATPELGQELSS